MVSETQQLALDEAESIVLKALFGSDKSVQISPLLNAFLKLKGIDAASRINSYISQFEAIVSPFMTEDGLISGTKIGILTEGLFPSVGEIHFPDFSLVDIVKKIEPMLVSVGKIIRSN